MQILLVVCVVGASLCQGLTDPPSDQFCHCSDGARKGGGVDCYIRRLISGNEVLLKLLHGDWALLGLGMERIHFLGLAR